MDNPAIALAEDLNACRLSLRDLANTTALRDRIPEIEIPLVPQWASECADYLRRLAALMPEVEQYIAVNRTALYAVADANDCDGTACAHEVPFEAVKELLYVGATSICANSGGKLNRLDLGGQTFLRDLYVDRRDVVAVALEAGGLALSQEFRDPHLYPRFFAFDLADIRGAIAREAARANVPSPPSKTRQKKKRALDSIDVAILRELAEANMALKQVELEQRDICSRRTLSDRLKQLRKEGRIHYPNGLRRGNAITPEGKRDLGDVRDVRH